jgi:hypothetical protein
VKGSAALAVVATAALLAVPVASPAKAPVRYKNCKALNAKYPHGVGRVGAKDKTTGTPVTTFRRNNRLYEANKGRDRDGDKIACEKA